MKTGWLDALFPPDCACAACGREWFDGHFCPDCEAKLTRNRGRFCQRCGMPVPGESRYCHRCSEMSVFFSRAYAAFAYDDGIKPLLRRYKEKGERWLADVFADELAAYCREYRISAEVLTYVPLTAAKRKRRGFDQSELLCRALSRRLGVPWEPMLERVRDSLPQKELGARERRENLRNCFRLLRPGNTELRSVLLIDDVMTTASTVNECCRILSNVCENGVKVLTICTTIQKTVFE